jgi:hypothetical protein
MLVKMIQGKREQFQIGSERSWVRIHEVGSQGPVLRFGVIDVTSFRSIVVALIEEPMEALSLLHIC